MRYTEFEEQRHKLRDTESEIEEADVPKVLTTGVCAEPRRNTKDVVHEALALTGAGARCPICVPAGREATQHTSE